MTPAIEALASARLVPVLVVHDTGTAVALAEALLLGGLPNLQRIDAFQVGENVVEMFQLHAGLERGAVDQLKAAIVVCDTDGDVGSSQQLRAMVAQEEGQLDWLTTQLELIEQLGESNYLAQQLYE